MGGVPTDIDVSELPDLPIEPDRPIDDATARRSRRQRLSYLAVLLAAVGLVASVLAAGAQHRDLGLEAAADASPTIAGGNVGAAAGAIGTQVTYSVEEYVEPATTEAPTTEAPTTTALPTTTTTAKPTTTTAKPTTTVAPKAAAAAGAKQQAPTTAAPTTAPAPAPVAAPTGGGGSGSEAAFLACVRRRESGGNYAIVSANGLYYGAYQFMRSTWDSAARIAGRPDLVGVPPNQVAPADQDAVALAYYRAVGSSPWGGACH